MSSERRVVLDRVVKGKRYILFFLCYVIFLCTLIYVIARVFSK